MRESNAAPRIVSLLIALLLLWPSFTRAEENDQILFLHLKLTNDTVSLVDSSIKPGRLKASQEPDRQGELHLELVATNGASLWSGVLADPLTRRYEYEDPATPGVLKLKVLQVTEAEFTVRVPFHKEAAHLRVQRLSKPANRKEALAGSAAKKWTSTVVLPRNATVP